MYMYIIIIIIQTNSCFNDNLLVSVLCNNKFKGRFVTMNVIIIIMYQMRNLLVNALTVTMNGNTLH